MDRYQRAEKPREETPIMENEIRVTSQGRMRNYMSYASILLQEKGSDKIVFKAMGRAINKTVMIVELIKRRIADLHQNTVIGSIDVLIHGSLWRKACFLAFVLPHFWSLNDFCGKLICLSTWDSLETTRHVSIITITLSKKELDTSSVGYQSPLPADLVKPHAEVEYDEENSPGPRGRDHGGRGRGRGRGDGDAINDYGDASWENRGRGYGRGGWNRSRGRSFRGRGRGGYGGPGYYQPEGGDYDEARRARGRAQFRGRGREFRSSRPAAQGGSEET
ncbi:unnamed protein product [Spirodela intermedia]|uniref:DNA/RNA-binding protein Alba-like domain-containing protein n=1 Tax=Spirodela intermedia TaxID=51605 RepID=A0A7I8IZK7_SPIIN|nr:unnamed protein product [Spirodela intermedia]CAA6663239.1 unnamed protein product [Spirodela intermedia]